MTKNNKKDLPQQLSNVINFDPSDIKSAQNWEDFVSLWMVTKEIEIRNQWYKGDIAEKAVVIHGRGSLNKFAQEVGESARTIEHYRRVARAFPENKRNWNLSWTHYLIASFTDSFKKSTNDFNGKNRFDWIEKAHDDGWSTTKLQAEIKKAHAMVNDSDTFTYYEEYLHKVRSVLRSVERDSLTGAEKNKLIHKFLDIYNEFMVYLKS